MPAFPTAYFFDADHPSLPDGFYGPPCTGAVVAACISRPDFPRAQILRGDLLIHRLAYEISSVSSEGMSSGRSYGARYSPNYDKLKLVVAEFSNSLISGFHTIDKIGFVRGIANGNTWTLLISHVPECDLRAVDEMLSLLPAYLGCAVVDLGNPLQVEALALVGGAFISDGKLYVECDAEVHGDERSVANGYGVDLDYIGLGAEEFHRKCPKLPEASISRGGEISAARVWTGESTHAERVADAIHQALRDGEISQPINFEVVRDVQAEYRFDDKKLYDYLLNTEHEHGKSKAVFFRDILAIERNQWRYLKDQILHGMKNAELYRFKNTQHGFDHGAYISITGLNGKTATIVVGWMFRDDGLAHFITAYPAGNEGRHEKRANPSWIVPDVLKGAAFWAELHRIADEAGKAAAKGVVPTPMFLEGYPPIFEGVCGFAWVLLPDARSKFCRWLSSHGIGHRHYGGGWDVWVDLDPNPPFYDTQSMEPKYRYARAYADVLNRNGIEAVAQKRLD